MADKSGSEKDDSRAEKDVFDAETSPSHDPGCEKAARILEEVGEVRQGLHQRHIQMISLAGTIGTGLFLGSGKAIARAGPLGALLGYGIIGIAASSVVMAIAEMTTLVPLTGGIIRLSNLFFDPALSFANGWNLVYSYLVSIPTEIVAAEVLIKFWVDINDAILIVVFGLLIVVCGCVFVRVYGELEFTFACLKILLIFMINIMALVITCGGGPTHDAIGFRYWRKPGPFVDYLEPGALGRFLGFWTVFSNALYAYAGIETITIAAAEVKRPRQAIPKAARRIFWRVLLFYIVSLFFVGLIVPSNNQDLLNGSGSAQSPFVIAARLAGVKVMPHIINAIAITSAWSASNSSMLLGSRVIYGLAKECRAPKIFARVNRFGIPWVAVGLLSVFINLGFMSMSSSASTVFQWLQDIVSISVLINWIVILGIYLRFYYGCRAQGIDRKTELPWAAPLMPYSAWVSLFLLALILLTSGYQTFMTGRWDSETFVASYLNIPFVGILYVGDKMMRKSKMVALKDIPIRPYIEFWHANPEEPEPPQQGWQKLNILWS